MTVSLSTHLTYCDNGFFFSLTVHLCCCHFSSKFGSVAGVNQKFIFVLDWSGMATPLWGQRGDNRVYPHFVWPRGLKHDKHPKQLIHPHQPTSIHSLQPHYYSCNPKRIRALFDTALAYWWRRLALKQVLTDFHVKVYIYIWVHMLRAVSCHLVCLLSVSAPMSPPRNLTIFNHTADSVWLNWEPPLEPNGLVIQYGFRIRDLITHTVTHRVLLISHIKSHSIVTTTGAHTPYHTLESHWVRLHSFTQTVALISHSRYPQAITLCKCTCADTVISTPMIKMGWFNYMIFFNACVCAPMQNSSGPSTAKYLSGFRPHSSYEISVYSYTRVGHGNQFSIPATFTTNESG